MTQVDDFSISAQTARQAFTEAHPGRDILRNLVHYRTYANTLPGGQKENRTEVIDRVKEMHQMKFPRWEQEIEAAFRWVHSGHVVPSMRTMQFGGMPVFRSPARAYNCGFSALQVWEDFADIFWLLMNGVGVGFSVQHHHISQLPIIRQHEAPIYSIPDNKEGWADSIKMLLNNPLQQFQYHLIRAKGMKLSSGGTASGPESLIRTHQILRSILTGALGRRLSSLEAHDIVCHMADVVVVGGVRRAALISLFDADDQEMLECKHGVWWIDNGQRARANNSAVILRSSSTFHDDLSRVLDMCIESNSGEPGFSLTNDINIGFNPCVTGDTWVMTDSGPKQVLDLLDTPHKSIIDGTAYDTTDRGFFPTGVKQVLKVTTVEGHEMRLTANHLVRRADLVTSKGERLSWVPAGELQVGDKIKLHNHRGLEWEGSGTFNEGWLIGLLIGDGTFNKTGSALLDFWGEHKFAMSSASMEIIREEVGARPDMKGHSAEKYDKVRVGSVGLANLAESYGVVRGNKTFTDHLHRTSSDFHSGLLRGMFDADGTITGTQTKGVSVRLHQANLDLVKRAQMMLQRLGIVSTIYQNRMAEGLRSLPDGKGGMADYQCKASHELVISGENIGVFSERVGFAEPSKAERLATALGNYKRKPNRERFVARVASVEPDGEEWVYDCTVPGPDAFDANGLYVHNCHEIALKNHQLCNLTEINVSACLTAAELLGAAQVASMIGTLQATYTNFHYLQPDWQANCEEDALLGVSLTGQAQGWDLLSRSFPLTAAAETATVHNRLWAERLGINPASRITTTKPSGSTSAWLGTTSGIHAAHAPFYKRRVRVDRASEMGRFLIENHGEQPPSSNSFIESDITSEDNIVVTVPLAMEGAIQREEESAVQLMERAKHIYENWILPTHFKGANTHNVSLTVNYKPGEIESVKAWMLENSDSWTGISLLPYDGGTYVQAPFEAISKSEYQEWVAKTPRIDFSQIRFEQDEAARLGEPACGLNGCEI